MSAKDDEQVKVDGEAAAAGVSGDAADASKSEVKDDVSDAEEFKSPEVKVDSVDAEGAAVDAVDGVGEGDGEHGEKSKSKARAEELSLQLEGVPALSRQSLEVSHVGFCTARTIRSKQFKRKPWKLHKTKHMLTTGRHALPIINGLSAIHSISPPRPRLPYYLINQLTAGTTANPISAKRTTQQQARSEHFEACRP